jgi:membrane protein YdbS with pleckstrin-like domain
MTLGHSEIPPQQPNDEADRPHKPTDDREEIYFQGTPKLRGELGKLLGFGLVGIILIAAPFAWNMFNKEWWPWWLVLASIALGVLMLLIPWIQTKFRRYRISNYRIDFEKGLIAKNIDTLELWHVEDINFHQSLSDRLMGVGTITVISHDETTPRLELKSLPDARRIFELLKQRVIAVKRQRGVIKMDMG